MEKKSIGIVIALIIAVIVVIFIFFQSFKTKEVPSEEGTQKEELVYPSITPDEVVLSFYNWYLAPDNALPSENYKTHPSLTDRFKNAVSIEIAEKTLENKDHFVCSTDLPIEISTGSVTVTDERANVVVNSTLSDVEMISFIAELDLMEDKSAWQINNVVCFIKGI